MQLLSCVVQDVDAGWAEVIFLVEFLDAIPSGEHFCFGFVLVMAHGRAGSLQPHNANAFRHQRALGPRQ